MIVLVNVISLAKSVFCKFKKSLNNIKKKSTCFRKCFFMGWMMGFEPTIFRATI